MGPRDPASARWHRPAATRRGRVGSGYPAGVNIGEAFGEIEERLAAVATPERAEREKRYLKSNLIFMGATVWQIRAAVKALAGSLRDVEHDELSRRA